MSNRAAVLTVATTGTVLVSAYAAFAAIQILVLNPLAALPDLSLSRIHADMAEFGESPGIEVALVVLGLGPGLALLLMVLLVPRRDSTVTAALLAYLSMLLLGAPAYFIASFGPGMALADTYNISGADYSEWGRVLYAASGVALIGLVALAVTHMTRGARTAPAAT